MTATAVGQRIAPDVVDFGSGWERGAVYPEVIGPGVRRVCPVLV